MTFLLTFFYHRLGELPLYTTTTTKKSNRVFFCRVQNNLQFLFLNILKSKKILIFLKSLFPDVVLMSFNVCTMPTQKFRFRLLCYLGALILEMLNGFDPQIFQRRANKRTKKKALSKN